MAVDIKVEVAYATPEKQKIITLEVPAGSKVSEAIAISGIRGEFPEMQVDPERIGIFGRKTTLEQELCDGDRVEIYRPLIADPKEARRKRALKNEVAR